MIRRTVPSQPRVSADEESSGDVLPGEDENNSEPVAAEELAAAALIVDQSVVESQESRRLRIKLPEIQMLRTPNAQIHGIEQLRWQPGSARWRAWREVN